MHERTQEALDEQEFIDRDDEFDDAAEMDADAARFESRYGS